MDNTNMIKEEINTKENIVSLTILQAVMLISLSIITFFKFMFIFRGLNTLSMFLPTHLAGKIIKITSGNIYFYYNNIPHYWYILYLLFLILYTFIFFKHKSVIKNIIIVIFSYYLSILIISIFSIMSCTLYLAIFQTYSLFF